MAGIDTIPFLGAYLQQQAANRAQPMQELQQAGAAVGLMQHLQQQQQAAAMRDAMAQSGGDVEKALGIALQTGNIAAAHQLAPLVAEARKAKQDKILQDALGGVGGNLDNADPARLRQIGQTLISTGHPGGAPLLAEAERRDKEAQARAQLAAMKTQASVQPDPQEIQQSADQGTPAPQATPSRPGMFADLMSAEAPGLANHAKMLQAQLDSQQGTNIPASYWERARDALAARETAYQTGKQRQQFTIDNRTEQPAYTNIQPDGKGGWTGLSRKTGQIEQVPASVASASSMSEDAVTNAAWEKLLFGKEPTGMSNASAAQKAQVRNEHARLVKELGLTPMEAAMLPNDNKVKMKAVDKLTTWGATVARSAEKLDLDLGVALDYAQKLPLGQIQLINRGVIAGKKEFNDPNANAYAAALNSVRQEYARLMAGPTSNAMLPVEAMKKGNELLSSGVDVASLQEVGNQMRRDAANTITATNNQIDGLKNSIRGLGKVETIQPTGGGLPSAAAIDAEIARRKAGGR